MSIREDGRQPSATADTYQEAARPPAGGCERREPTAERRRSLYRRRRSSLALTKKLQNLFSGNSDVLELQNKELLQKQEFLRNLVQTQKEKEDWLKRTQVPMRFKGRSGFFDAVRPMAVLNQEAEKARGRGGRWDVVACCGV